MGQDDAGAQHRIEHAHFTKLSALSTIGALEALAWTAAELAASEDEPQPLLGDT